MIQQEHSVVMMVETHLNNKKMDGAHNELCRHRWQPMFLEAHETGRGGNSGGHLFCVREGQSGYRLHAFDLEGNGFLANVLQRQHWGVVLVSLYLKCGEDLNSRANSTILGELAAFLQELAIAWIVVGDFQVPPEQICCGQPTLVNGAELDYLLACRTVAPFIDIKVTLRCPVETSCWTCHQGGQGRSKAGPSTVDSVPLSPQAG